ncbi:MAG: ATP-binding protein [Bacteroidota bacterium]|nr:ATP-binding protein [Bacteroidota bacterium]
MLLNFKTSNNRSFNEELDFSMVAAHYEDQPDNIIPVPKYKINILKSSVIYGANASGKSNVLKAIADGAVFIRTSFREGSEAGKMPFRYNKHFKKNEKGVTFYQYGILIDDSHFEYYFSINSERIVEEKLLEYHTQKPITHFHRKYDTETGSYSWKKFSKFFLGEKESMKNIANLNHKALFLSICAEGKLPVAEKVITWFREKLVWVIDNNSPGSFNVNLTLDMIYENEEFRKNILKRLSNADFIIKELKLDLISKEGKGQKYNVNSYHSALDEEGKEYDAEFNFFTEESTGTRRLLAWLGIWSLALDKGWTILIDELGNSMHTLLSKHLVNEFSLGNKNQSQLIFTTHDTNLMTPQIFRRDQIWIVDKDRMGNSNLSSVSDFKVRKGHVIENSYLQGLYGGIPYIID